MDEKQLSVSMDDALPALSVEDRKDVPLIHFLCSRQPRYNFQNNSKEGDQLREKRD
jgi:hypothetical protein